MTPDAADDARLDLAAILEPGDVLELFRADGPLVRLTVAAVEDTDLVGVVDAAARVRTADLLTARLHRGDDAWFATFLVRGGEEERPDGTRRVTLAIGDALQVTSERWAERVPLHCAALLREESGSDLLRGTVTDASLTGVAVLVHGDAVPLDAHVGATLEGDGRGAIAFRARVIRRAPVPGGYLLGLEILGISGADHGRLARVLARQAARHGVPE